MKTVEVKVDGQGLRVGIALSRFNELIGGKLLQGAEDALLKGGVHPDDIALMTVPGAFELPLVLGQCAKSGRFDALVALGAVIRGETPHFDYVAGEAARGIAEVSLNSGVPIAFGVLTCDTIEQALARTDERKVGNKGAEAARCAIEMARLLQSI